MTSHGTDLRRIPLVRQMLDDTEIRVVQRAVDLSWSYRGLAEVAPGWNPWAPELYVGRRSATTRWLDNLDADLRWLNEGDALLREVLFLAHDYLHAWAVRVIQHECPELEFGFGAITKDNVEDHVFAMILTEAIATVGLDYWYLSGENLDAMLGIGTRLGALTTAYDERDLDEYRTAYPTLDVQSREFFVDWTRFYLSGELEGFGIEDLRSSPKLMFWLKKELRYGDVQRKYARGWMEHFAGTRFYENDSSLTGPVPCDAPWQRALIERFSDLLWEKVKDDSPAPTPTAVTQKRWAAPASGPIDFGLTNALAFDDVGAAIADRGMKNDSFDYLFAQLFSSLGYEEHADRLSPCMKPIFASKSVPLLLEVVSHHTPIEPTESESFDMMFHG